MLDKFVKNQFSEYSKNQRFDKTALLYFQRELENKIKTSAELIYSPSQDSDVIRWSINKTSKGLKYKLKTGNLKQLYFSKFFNTFLNITTSYLRKFGFLVLVLKIDTGERYKNEPIVELWGYRLFVLEKMTYLMPLNHDEIYTACTTSETGEEIKANTNYIYCGPTDKIYGWDKN